MSMRTKHGTLPRLPRGCFYFHRSAITSSSAKPRGIHGGVTLTPNSLPHCAQKLPNSSFIFVSRDFRRLFTLWTDAVTPGPATVDKPSRLQRTRSPLGHPRCCSWAEEVPLRTRPFQHLPGATVSGYQFLGAPRQSSATAMPSLKTRSSEPSCQL